MILLKSARQMARNDLAWHGLALGLTLIQSQVAREERIKNKTTACEQLLD